jgi:hypothetical protein
LRRPGSVSSAGVPVIAVFFFEGDRTTSERVHFDAASLLA